MGRSHTAGAVAKVDSNGTGTFNRQSSGQNSRQMTDTPSTQPAAVADADYEAAMESIHRAIDHFRGCTPEERASLQRDLDQLHSMADKLAAGKVEIVVFGEISTGKSALINALVGEAVAEG